MQKNMGLVLISGLFFILGGIVDTQVFAAPSIEAIAEREVISVNATSIGEKIKLIEKAGSLKELKAKLKPAVVVVQSDQDRTFFCWRTNDGVWSLAEVFKFKAAAGMIFAIGERNENYSYNDGLSYPIFKRTFPRIKVKKLAACPRNKKYPDACGSFAYVSGGDWIRWTEKIAGHGGIVEQHVFFFRGYNQDKWIFFGADSVSCGRNGANETYASQTKYWYDAKGCRIFCNTETTNNYSISYGEADEIRLPVKTYTSKIIRRSGIRKSSMPPYLKVADLEILKDKYMGGEITLESVAGLLWLYVVRKAGKRKVMQKSDGLRS